MDHLSPHNLIHSLRENHPDVEVDEDEDEEEEEEDEDEDDVVEHGETEDDDDYNNSNVNRGNNNDISSLVASFHDELPIPSILEDPEDNHNNNSSPKNYNTYKPKSRPQGLAIPSIHNMMNISTMTNTVTQAMPQLCAFPHPNLLLKHAATANVSTIRNVQQPTYGAGGLIDILPAPPPVAMMNENNNKLIIPTTTTASTTPPPSSSSSTGKSKSSNKSRKSQSNNNNKSNKRKSKAGDKKSDSSNGTNGAANSSSMNEIQEAQQLMDNAEKEYKSREEMVEVLELELTSFQRKVKQARDDLKEKRDRYRRTLTLYKDLDINKPTSCQWNDMYHRLIRYKQQHGHTLVPHKDKDNDKELTKLGRWVANQRVFYKMHCDGKLGHIKPHRIEALNDIGFCWNKYEYLWNRRYEELKDYHRTYGHTRVPKHCATHSQELCEWCIVQVREYKAHCDGCPTTMNEYRIAQLNKLGFTWQSPPTFSEKIPYRYQKKRAREVFETKKSSPNINLEQQWTKGYQELVEYYKKYGDCKVNREEGREINVKLRRFVSWIRFEYKRFMDQQEQNNDDDDDDDDDDDNPNNYSNKRGRDGNSTSSLKNRPMVITWERIKLLQDLDFPWGHGNTEGRVRNPRTIKAKAEAEARMKQYNGFIDEDYNTTTGMEENSLEQQSQREHDGSNIHDASNSFHNIAYQDQRQVQLSSLKTEQNLNNDVGMVSM